jgi:predicted protein tyrosine phosphatase
MKVLFICNQNLHRSKTAEELFKDEHTTRSAGLYNEKPVEEDDLIWADLIVVMEEVQRAELGKRFPSAYMKKRIISWNIPDVYGYNDPKLIEIIKKKSF